MAGCLIVCVYVLWGKNEWMYFFGFWKNEKLLSGLLLWKNNAWVSVVILKRLIIQQKRPKQRVNDGPQSQSHATRDVFASFDDVHVFVNTIKGTTVQCDHDIK